MPVVLELVYGNQATFRFNHFHVCIEYLNFVNLLILRLTKNVDESISELAATREKLRIIKLRPDLDPFICGFKVVITGVFVT